MDRKQQKTIDLCHMMPVTFMQHRRQNRAMAVNSQIDTLGGTPSNSLPTHTHTHASMARKQAGKHARMQAPPPPHTDTHTHTLTRAEPCRPMCVTASSVVDRARPPSRSPLGLHAKAVMAAHSQARPPLFIRRENVIRPASAFPM